MRFSHHRDADPDLRILVAIRAELDATQQWVRAVRRLLLYRKFRPDQLRVPAGDPDGGQWTDEGRGSSGSAIIRRINSDGDPPGSPPDRSDARTRRQRELSQEVRRRLSLDIPLDGLFALLEAAQWSVRWLYEIRADADEPKDLEQLLDDASRPRLGYQLHHIVERSSAYADGFGADRVEGADNIVRIPTLKHYEINGFYSKSDRDYGNKSPREYLRGKSWDLRVEFGLNALRKFGVLK
jgi:hypothetical protein